MSDPMMPYIRIHNYVQDYWYTLYQHYISHYRAMPITYYSLNESESIYEGKDGEGLRAATYDKYGVGANSGLKYNKIQMFPVFQMEQIVPNQESGDTGLTYRDSLITKFSFPEIYGLKPSQWDYVDISFGMTDTTSEDKPIFIVTNFNLSHMSEEFNLYDIHVKVAPSTRDELELQVINDYTFYEPTKSILPTETAANLYNIINNCNTLSDNLNNIFDNNSSFYLYNT